MSCLVFSVFDLARIGLVSRRWPTLSKLPLTTSLVALICAQDACFLFMLLSFMSSFTLSFSSTKQPTIFYDVPSPTFDGMAPLPTPPPILS
jgi:hypothetical protein